MNVNEQNILPDPEHDGSTKMYSTSEYSFASRVNASFKIVLMQEAPVSFTCSHKEAYLC